MYSVSAPRLYPPSRSLNILSRRRRKFGDAAAIAMHNATGASRRTNRPIAGFRHRQHRRDLFAQRINLVSIHTALKSIKFIRAYWNLMSVSSLALRFRRVFASRLVCALCHKFLADATIHQRRKGASHPSSPDTARSNCHAQLAALTFALRSSRSALIMTAIYHPTTKR